MRMLRILAPGFAVLLVWSCAALGSFNVQAPRFAVASDQPSELRLLAPSAQRPLGGAAVRLYASVENPNPFGVTLSTLAGTLLLDGHEAADADFPLGLGLQAGQAAVVPLDLSLSFANLPGLVDVLGQAVTAGQVAYALRGTARVDAGIFGQPTFGPMTLLEGTAAARR